MKKRMIAFFVALLIPFALQAGTPAEKNIISQNLQDKVAVKPEDLPEAIKSTLAGDAYAGWKISGAFLVTREDNSQFYEVSLRKADETSTINFDKYGKKID